MESKSICKVCGQFRALQPLYAKHGCRVCDTGFWRDVVTLCPGLSVTEVQIVFTLCLFPPPFSPTRPSWWKRFKIWHKRSLGLEDKPGLRSKVKITATYYTKLYGLRVGMCPHQTRNHQYTIKNLDSTKLLSRGCITVTEGRITLHRS